jgi:hypothetical protein
MKLPDVVNDIIYNEGIHVLLTDALAGDGRLLREHPYKKFVEYQRDKYQKKGLSLATEGFQIGELWNGDSRRGRVLFLSPNPAIDVQENFPRYHAKTGKISWPNGKEMSVDDVKRFFTNRFQNAPVKGLKLHVERVDQNGVAVRPKVVPHWGCVLDSMAKLNNVLLDDNTPENDIRNLMKNAFTMDIVPFKSGAQYGVDEALHRCVRRFAAKILPHVSAPVVVLVGKKVQQAFLDLVPHDDKEWGKAKEAFDKKEIIIATSRY